MAHNNHIEQQFVVSKELIQLLKWLVEHEPENIKKLVQQALEDGLHEDMQHHDKEASNEEMQQSIVDFFSLLENVLHEVYSSDSNMHTHTLFPELHHIDSHACDNNTLAVSAAKASSTLQEQDTSADSAKQALCKALIKYWNPGTSRAVH